MKEHNLETLEGFTLKSFEEGTGYSVKPIGYDVKLPIPEGSQGSVKNSDNKLDDNMDESDDMNEGDDD